MFTNTKIATTALIALSLSMGLSACSPAQNDSTPPATSASATASATASQNADTKVTVPSETASATADSSNSSDPSLTAEAANTRVNDFMATIKVDALALNADPDAKATASKTVGAFDKAFANSIAYFDTSRFSDNKVEQVVGGFASVYMADPSATIISKDADSVKISGDNAVIDGNAFTVTLKGVEKKGSSGSGGSVVMTFADGAWKITGWVDGPSSK